MGSFPSSLNRTSSAPAFANGAGKAKRSGHHKTGIHSVDDTKNFPNNPTNIGSVCFTYLSGIPLARLLETPLGAKHFSVYCSEHRGGHLLQLYLALALKHKKMVEADEMMDEDASKMAILESSFRQVASTTRLSDKAIACIQISLNNGGQFSSVFELQEVMTEIIATLSTIEWLFSQEGRDYMCESARFDQFLHDQLAMGFFHQFLVQEYSSENLEFIESVLMFESDWASLDIESPQYPLSSNIARARQIVKLYVEDNAPLQINVPSKIRVRLERKVIKDGEPAKDMFRAAKGEISNLIQKDSWPRFKKSLWWSSYMNFDLQQLSSSAFGVMRSKRHEMYLQFIGDDNLSTILCSDIGQEYLRAFLTIMASKVDGSIDFFLSVQRLKEEKGKFEKVRQIFDWHFSEMAPFPVLHVSPDVAANIQGCITCNPIAVSDLQNFYATAASQTEAYLNEKALPLFKLNGLYAKYRVLSQQRVRVEDTKPVVAAKNISKVY